MYFYFGFINHLKNIKIGSVENLPVLYLQDNSKGGHGHNIPRIVQGKFCCIFHKHRIYKHGYDS